MIKKSYSVIYILLKDMYTFQKSCQEDSMRFTILALKMQKWFPNSYKSLGLYLLVSSDLNLSIFK